MHLFFILLFYLTLQVLIIDSKSGGAEPTLHDQKIHEIKDFRTFITTKKNFYIDKTLFIKEVMDSCKESVILISRPSGFGKTLALSTLEHYLSSQLKDSEQLFTGLGIMKTQQDLSQLKNSHMRKYPVIRIDFSGVRGLTYRESYKAIQDIISKEFLKHKYAVDGKTILKTTFDAIVQKSADEKTFEDSISWLSRWVSSYHNGTKRAIVLIDGYDIPIHTSFIGNYYEEMKEFMWQFLLRTLKLNSNLQKAVLTGVIPVSGDILPLNVVAHTIFDEKCSKLFGFTRDDVVELIERTNEGEETQKKKLDGIDAMFNGYTFGSSTVFNPRAVSSYLFENKARASIDSTSRKILQSLVLGYGLYPILTLQQLLVRENITKDVSRNLDFSSEKNPEKDHWTYMLHAGYLTTSFIPDSKERDLTVILRIPNLEIHAEIATALKMSSGLKIPDYSDFTDNLIHGYFDAAKAALDRYLGDAGILFKSSWRGIEQDRLVNYVIQMLRGVELRYNTKVIRSSHPLDSIQLSLRNDDFGVPIIIWIIPTSGTSILWFRMTREICPIVRDENKMKRMIVMVYSTWCIGTCFSDRDYNVYL